MKFIDKKKKMGRKKVKVSKDILDDILGENKMKKSELRAMIKEEMKNLNESISDDFSKALQKLITNIKDGKGIDKKMYKEKTTGELLGMILSPIMQSELIRLDDRKGFHKNFRI